jgi:rhomboid protease GluP
MSAAHSQSTSAPPLGAHPRSRPFVTFAMIATLWAAFAAEQLFRLAPSHGVLAPSVSTLVALGALSRPLVLDSHEFYRLFSAALLHVDLVHLLINSVALFVAGATLEALLGRGWLLFLFWLGALGGSIVAIIVHPADVGTVGASGGVMGLLAVGFVTAFHLPSGSARSALQRPLLVILLPSLIPIVTHRVGGRGDYAAHLGGALAGTIAGLALVRAWPGARAVPRYTRVARSGALVAVVVFAASEIAVARSYPAYRAQFGDSARAREGAYAALLIPASEVPHEDRDVLARADALVSRYPHDPRAHLFAAMRRVHDDDFGAAERHLRAALDERDVLHAQFADRRLEVAIRGTLADVLIEQNRRGEAVTAVLPVCTAGEDGGTPESLRGKGLCPSP